MAFYIIVKGKITPFQFRYLDSNIPVHLEKTQIHSEELKGKSKIEAQKLLKDPVAIEAMTSKLITLSPAAKIRDAQNLMKEKKLHHIPLLIGTLLVGLISEKDLPHDPNLLEQEIRVSQIMSKIILCADEQTPLRHVAKVFMEENINSLPIIDENLMVTGIITHRDLLKWLLKNNQFTLKS
ncbi:MAG: CBS domain-containing protein [Bacteriovoracaceae bacterium]